MPSQILTNNTILSPHFALSFIEEMNSFVSGVTSALSRPSPDVL